jgi:glycosyltransferase involved in cell wall biosynthesis
MRIAILTSVFMPEFGVARVIASQLPYMVKAGLKIDLYACELDRKMLCDGVCAVRVPTHLRGLRSALIHGHYDVIIAHTDPFYRFLAECDCGAKTIGFEHGYPPVDLCPAEEKEARLKEIGNRLGEIYPALTKVVTISRYGAEYLKWPTADIIYNGADHYEKSYGAKGKDISGPIQLLAVTRYRKGEWKYKGLENILQLKKDLGDRCEITVVGRGDEESKKTLLDAGIKIAGIISDEELAGYYSASDALVSFSQWELFNLPLAEAGFAHTPALALNVCAHPEVTPFVFSSYEGVRAYLMQSTKGSLRLDGEKMYSFVSERFRWEQNVQNLLDVIKSVAPESNNKKASFAKSLTCFFWNAREALRQNIYKKWVKRT